MTLTDYSRPLPDAVVTRCADTACPHGVTTEPTEEATGDER